MSEVVKSGRNFIGYEYKEVKIASDKASLYVDGYVSFGWDADDNMQQVERNGQVDIKLKRDRKIGNKAELTRLQRHFEACVKDIEALENSVSSVATMASIIVGMLGTAFMAGSVFAITNEQQMVLLCILFAIPGLIGWILPSIIFKILVKRRTEKLAPLIDQKYDEIYDICEKGNKLLKNKQSI